MYGSIYYVEYKSSLDEIHHPEIAIALRYRKMQLRKRIEMVLMVVNCCTTEILIFMLTLHLFIKLDAICMYEVVSSFLLLSFLLSSENVIVLETCS